jgi:hypothetical protein
MDTQQIIELFQRAINNVDDIYYGRDWWNDSMLNYHEIYENDARRKIIEPYLATYGERVFCYELYHQMRIQLDNYIKDGGTISPLYLQAELKKEHIGDLAAKNLGLEVLDKEYIPDFLLHCPDSTEHQELIIEVKTDPKLTPSKIKEDLLKIQEFITRYKYQKGIFLTVNTEADKMLKNLTKNRHWLQERLPEKSQIIFMCKTKRNSSIFTRNLGDFFDP